MPKRNAKGHFVKSKSKSRKSHSKAMTHVRHHAPATRVVYRTRSAPKQKRRHHRKGHGGGMNLTHLAIAGAGLAFLTGAGSPIAAIPENIAKIPGAKTFGNPATAGLVCLGIDRFVKRNRWLRAAGVIGVVLGAVQVGTQGKDFKWVGDSQPDNGFSGDIDGDEVGDDDDMVGDDDE